MRYLMDRRFPNDLQWDVSKLLNFWNRNFYSNRLKYLQEAAIFLHAPTLCWRNLRNWRKSWAVKLKHLRIRFSCRSVGHRKGGRDIIISSNLQSSEIQSWSIRIHVRYLTLLPHVVQNSTLNCLPTMKTIRYAIQSAHVLCVLYPFISTSLWHFWRL